MSRRPPNPAAERAAQNQQTIKSLLKLEANKVCADCKRNKHPRWASWNLGVFICIRCSGIHRGMGTHISRVKSVDLDSWTDEQLQSILSWGNARANKYWEAKLAQGHVPSESKIENFIRTKYELKRWVMDGPIPDPATLDVEGDDDIPLSIVKEKQNIDRKESVRKASLGQSSAPKQLPPRPEPDLIGGDDPVPPRASTAGPVSSKVPAKAEPAPPKTTNTKDSLLGLDFLGSDPAPPPRPASTTATGGMGGPSRPDLKQSILSLYATAPRPQPPQQQPIHASADPFGGLQSPSAPVTGQQPQPAVGGLNDAFSGLSFSSTTGPKSPQSSAFSNLGSFSSSRSPPQTTSSTFSGLSGGGFFDAKPTPAPAPHQSNKPSIGGTGGFGGFGSPAPPPKPAGVPASAALGDLFDFSSPAPASQPAAAPAPSAAVPSVTTNSVFNLSSNAPQPTPAATTPGALNNAGSLASSNLSNNDVWGGNAWAAAEPANSAVKSPAATKTTDFGWGASSSLANTPIVPGASGGFNTAPKVAADEEFGGWASSTGGNTTANASTGGGKAAGGFGTSEDLFSNVWQ